MDEDKKNIIGSLKKAQDAEKIIEEEIESKDTLIHLDESPKSSDGLDFEEIGEELEQEKDLVEHGKVVDEPDMPMTEKKVEEKEFVKEEKEVEEEKEEKVQENVEKEEKAESVVHLVIDDEPYEKEQAVSDLIDYKTDNKKEEKDSESNDIDRPKASWDLIKGFFKENPVFSLVLGLCPVLAVSNAVENALAMGAATIFVLLSSNTIVSLFRKYIPDKVRIPSYITIIATFVTIAGMLLAAYLPEINKALGIFVPLIVVNCIILGRAEAFASKNNVYRSILDAIGMGIGFTMALTLIAFFRELLGTGAIKIFGVTLFSIPISPALIFILPPGALLTMGLLLGYFQYRTGKKEVGCAHCLKCEK